MPIYDSTVPPDYQTAPVGARSKRRGLARLRRAPITRQPLWGRDQNRSDWAARGAGYYQTAPVGARSKRLHFYIRRSRDITRQPLWGRDQNLLPEKRGNYSKLPDSPCGGEIKTTLHTWRNPDIYYQTAPVGARSKKHLKNESFWNNS